MIAVFVALKMPLSIRVQRLFAYNLMQIKTKGNYLALKFLYFRSKLLIYDPKLLKIFRTAPKHDHDTLVGTLRHASEIIK